MRTITVAVCLVASTMLAAQPIVTNEVIVETHPSSTPSLQIASPAVALASDRSGVALAWAVPGGIHIARLGGPIRVLPPRSAEASVMPIAPSLAATPDDEGFVAAWVETNRGRHGLGRPLGALAFLDASLAAEPPAFLPPNEIKSPVIVRTGSTAWITADRYVWQVERDGTARLAFDSDFHASALAIVDDEPTVLSRMATSERGCYAPAQSNIVVGPVCYETFSRLRLDQRFATLKPDVPRLRSMAEPAVAVEGDQLLVVWMRGDQKKGGDVVLSTMRADAPDSFATALDNAKRAGRFAPDDGPTRPDIATNGRQRLIVWRNNTVRGYDVVGALIDADGKITRFDVATSNADERDPSVLALPGGNFVVAYEKFSSGQRSIAWRLVLVEGRRRAVR